MQNLVVQTVRMSIVHGGGIAFSRHLCDYPVGLSGLGVNQRTKAGRDGRRRDHATFDRWPINIAAGGMAADTQMWTSCRRQRAT